MESNYFQRAILLIRRNFFQLLLVEVINYAVYYARFFYFTRIKRNVRAFDDRTGVVMHDYSVTMLKAGKTSNRPLRFIRPLSVLDRVPKDGHVLSIGCRFETELLYLVGHGFDRRKVRGLDMVAYSPWVDLGNMHDMPYPDGTWDVVLLGWVMAYSDEPAKAAKEVIRVCKDGGVVAVSVSYYPQERLDQLALAGTAPSVAKNRIQSVDGLLALFGDHVAEVFFRHDAVDPASEGVCAVIFSLTKK